MLKRLACLLTLLFNLNTQAALIQYEVELGPNSSDADGGLATFLWDADNLLISDFTWDFGQGNAGGYNDAFVEWDRLIDGTTIAAFLFEVLTGVDVSNLSCTTPNTGCGFGRSGSEIFGFTDTMEFNVVDGSIRTYGFFQLNAAGTDNEFIQGSILSVIGSPVDVPSPPTIALLLAGLVGLVALRRRPS